MVSQKSITTSAATIRKIYAIVGFILSLLIAIAIFLISSGRKYSKVVQASITEADRPTADQSRLNLSYKFNDKTLDKTVDTPFDVLYTKDGVIDIYVNPIDPHDIVVNKPSTMLGYILIALAIMIVIGVSVL